MFSTLFPYNLDRHSSWWSWGTLLFLISFGIRLWMLTQTSVATGTDGYYFAEQARFFAEHGRFRSFENSIVVVFFGVIQRLGVDPVLAVKWGVSLLVGAAAPAGFIYAVSTSGRLYHGLLLGLFLAVSPSLSYLCAHFPKTAGSLVFLFLALAALERSFQSKTRERSWTWLIVSVLLLLALASSHKLVFLIGVWVSVGIFLDHWTTLPPIRWRSWGLGIAVGLVGLVLAMKAVIPSDLDRLWPAFTWPQGWPLKILGEKVFLHSAIQAEVIMALLALAPGIVFLRSKTSGRFQTLSWLLLIPLLFNPFLDFHVLDLGYRLMLVVFLPGIALWSRWAGSDRRGFAMGMVACGLFFIFSGRVYVPTLDEENVETYQKLIERMPKNDFPLVICHLGLNYYYTWATGKDTLAFVPDDRVYPPEATWRISWGVSRDAYDGVLSSIGDDRLSEVRMLTTDYALIREDIWRMARARVPPGTFLESLMTSWRNPHAARARFIVKRSAGASQ